MSGAVWLGAIDLAFLACCLLLIGLTRSLERTALHPVRLPLVCWLSALTVGLILHGSNAQASRDLLALAGGPLVLCVAATSWGQWRRRLSQGIVLGAVLISLFAVWQYLVILPELAARSAATGGSAISDALHEVTARRRAFGTFSLPILLAAYLAITIPLAVDRAMRARVQSIGWRWMLWIAVAMNVMAFTVTRSIGALISLGLACVIVWSRRQPSRSSILIVAAIGALCAGVVLHGRTDAWTYGNRHHPIHNRLVYWDAVLQLITTHPIMGIGPGRFGEAYRTVSTDPQLGVRHAHNSYLQIWAEWGLLGLIGWCWLLLVILGNTASLSPWLAIALWTLPLCNLFDFSFYIPQVSFLWWYLAGWSLRHPHRCQTPCKVSDTKARVRQQRRQVYSV